MGIATGGQGTSNVRGAGGLHLALGGHAGVSSTNWHIVPCRRILPSTRRGWGGGAEVDCEAEALAVVSTVAMVAEPDAEAEGEVDPEAVAAAVGGALAAALAVASAVGSCEAGDGLQAAVSEIVVTTE